MKRIFCVLLVLRRPNHETRHYEYVNVIAPVIADDEYIALATVRSRLRDGEVDDQLDAPPDQWSEFKNYSYEVSPEMIRQAAGVGEDD